MNLNVLKNFVSKLGFIYERSINSNGYNLEISVQKIDDTKQIIAGEVDMIISAEEREIIKFTSLLEHSERTLRFESSYRIGNVKINQEERIETFESKEVEAEDMFLIVDNVEKTNVFNPILGQKNKLLIHKDGDTISHIYRVGQNYKFNNGISESFMLLNMRNEDVVARVNQVCNNNVIRR